MANIIVVVQVILSGFIVVLIAGIYSEGFKTFFQAFVFRVMLFDELVMIVPIRLPFIRFALLHIFIGIAAKLPDWIPLCHRDRIDMVQNFQQVFENV